MIKCYKLVGKEVTLCENIQEWLLWFEENFQKRHVAFTEIQGVKVYTTFIGLDKRLLSEGPPLFFETAIQTEAEGFIVKARHSTWEEAELYHMELVKSLQPAET